MNEETPFYESPRSFIPHYHGDIVRVLFVLAAGLIFLAELLNGNLPFSTAATVLIAVLLVISAGITNPAQLWIHWVNLFFSLIGLILFGGTALTRFRTDAPFSESFLVGVIAVVFLAALYLSTRTVRGHMVHKEVEGKRI